MRLTKERKAYVAIFGLGLVALVADRLFFTPAGASAAAPDAAPESTQALAAPHAPSEAAPEAPAGPSFAERLAKQANWPQAPVRDAFIAPVAWVGQRVAAAGEKEVVTETAFRLKYKLTAAMVGGAKGGVAVLGGRTYPLNEVIDGYTLVEIHAERGKAPEAVFDHEGTRLTLVGPSPAAAPSPHKPDKQADPAGD